MRAAAEESEVAAVLGGNQFDPGIRAHFIPFKDLERNERIVLGLNQQRGCPDGLQIIDRRLSPIVILRIAESKRGSRDLIVDCEDRVQPIEIPAREPAGSAGIDRKSTRLNS